MTAMAPAESQLSSILPVLLTGRTNGPSEILEARSHLSIDVTEAPSMHGIATLRPLPGPDSDPSMSKRRRNPRRARRHPPWPRYVALFNQRNSDALRAMLADDVWLVLSTYPLRAGAADVGMFFCIYSRSAPVRLAPAWLDGREVIAVYEDAAAVKPSYLMWLEWTDGRITFIRDYKYVRYVIDDAELVLAPDTAPPGEATANG